MVVWKNHNQKTIHDQTIKNSYCSWLIEKWFYSSFLLFFFWRGVDLVGLEGARVVSHWQPTFPCALCPADAVRGDGSQHRTGAGGAHQEPPVRRRHRLLRVGHGAARQPAGRAAPQPDPRRQGQRRAQLEQGEGGVAMSGEPLIEPGSAVASMPAVWEEWVVLLSFPEVTGIAALR